MGWREVFRLMAGQAETRFDRLRARLDERFGNEPYQIIPYFGYGSTELVTLKGRVLEDNGLRAAGDNDTVWRNLLNTYRRFASDEVPGARVRVEFAGHVQEVVANDEGYFECSFVPPAEFTRTALWHPVELTLLHPQGRADGPIQALGQVLVPLPGAQFGIISDIDDTVLRSDVNSIRRTARYIFLGNARTRLPFPGVAALYQALHQGKVGAPPNPIFYVSSSPWNLYDLLVDFFRLRHIPLGPLFLRDWGFGGSEDLPTRHQAHKLNAIGRVLDRYPELPFILLGDSGQADPEIYSEVAANYPKRILAIYIRNIRHTPEREGRIRALEPRVTALGSTLLLADDTLAMAHHAVDCGWIAPGALNAVASDKAVDETPPALIDVLLEEDD